MVGTAEIDSAPPDIAESIADIDDDVSSVTTDHIRDLMRPAPAFQINARLDLPAWFVVLVSYAFAYGLGSFSTRCS